MINLIKNVCIPKHLTIDTLFDSLLSSNTDYNQK